MKARHIVTTLIILVVLFASLSFWLGGNQKGNSAGGEKYWVELAEEAWRYFQPGKGVDATTGLSHAGLEWPYFTDWDLGIYIQAIIDVEKLDLLARDGPWGGDERIEKLLAFLEARELTAEGIPYIWYDSRTGDRFGDKPTNPYDTGKLLVALGNLKLHKPELAGLIDHIVYEGTNYETLASKVDGWTNSLNDYSYYCAKGFSYFWPERFTHVAEAVLENIMSAEKVETYGLELPAASITCDPILHAVFELQRDSRLLELAQQVYLAHEARYQATGNYTAFSEGNTDLSDPSYLYEFVVRPDGRTWVIRDPSGTEWDIPPIIYFKVAVGFNAIYGTEFASRMMEYVKSLLPEPSDGYMDGVDANERVVSTVIDKTNGLIICAARYAMNQLDLSRFPWPFIQDRVANNTLVVIGESKAHGPVGAAHTMEALGGMLVTLRLARDSTSGAVNAGIDGWMASYDSDSGNITLLDTTSNLFIIGNPGINLVGYYYNDLRDSSDEPFAPVLFHTNYTEAYNYLYIPTSGSTYRMEFDEEDRLIADYGTIMIFRDQFGRCVVMVYGVGAEGTRVASVVLRDYDLWSLQGRAVIVKFYTDIPGEYPSTISIVETVP